jgi:hypothetical protein
MEKLLNRIRCEPPDDKAASRHQRSRSSDPGYRRHAALNEPEAAEEAVLDVARRAVGQKGLLQRMRKSATRKMRLFSARLDRARLHRLRPVRGVPV